MANSVTTEVLLDGPRNYIVKCVGVLDTSDVAPFILVDVSTMGTIGQNFQPDRVRVDRIVSNVEDTLEVRLQWDATAPVYLASLVGHGHDEYDKIGGLSNNAGAGITGNILLSTQGWSTGSVLSFSVILECVKTRGVTA